MPSISATSFSNGRFCYGNSCPLIYTWRASAYCKFKAFSSKLTPGPGPLLTVTAGAPRPCAAEQSTTWPSLSSAAAFLGSSRQALVQARRTFFLFSTSDMNSGSGFQCSWACRLSRTASLVLSHTGSRRLKDLSSGGDYCSSLVRERERERELDIRRAFFFFFFPLAIIGAC